MHGREIIHVQHVLVLEGPVAMEKNKKHGLSVVLSVQRYLESPNLTL